MVSCCTVLNTHWSPYEISVDLYRLHFMFSYTLLALRWHPTHVVYCFVLLRIAIFRFFHILLDYCLHCSYRKHYEPILPALELIYQSAAHRCLFIAMHLLSSWTWGEFGMEMPAVELRTVGKGNGYSAWDWRWCAFLISHPIFIFRLSFEWYFYLQRTGVRHTYISDLGMDSADWWLHI